MHWVLSAVEMDPMNQSYFSEGISISRCGEDDVVVRKREIQKSSDCYS
jgi:hypothetical protein